MVALLGAAIATMRAVDGRVSNPATCGGNALCTTGGSRPMLSPCGLKIDCHVQPASFVTMTSRPLVAYMRSGANGSATTCTMFVAFVVQLGRIDCQSLPADR